MIRIDAMWLATAPMDMRAGADKLLARVVAVFGSAQAHHGYLFANARANRMKLLVHDGFGVWCATRRLHQGGFAWPGRQAAISADATAADPATEAPIFALTADQFDAMVLGLPWQRLTHMQTITHL